MPGSAMPARGVSGTDLAAMLMTAILGFVVLKNVIAPEFMRRLRPPWEHHVQKWQATRAWRAGDVPEMLLSLQAQRLGRVCPHSRNRLVGVHLHNVAA